MCAAEVQTLKDEAQHLKACLTLKEDNATSTIELLNEAIRILQGGKLMAALELMAVGKLMAAMKLRVAIRAYQSYDQSIYKRIARCETLEIKQYGGKWIKIEPDEVIILNESRKLLELEAYKVHYRNQIRTGSVLLKYRYSHMVPTKSLLNCNSIDLENFVLIKVQFKADLTDPELERLSITREEAEDVLDFNREHPRNPAKRRRFDQTSLNFISTLYRYLWIMENKRREVEKGEGGKEKMLKRNICDKRMMEKMMKGMRKGFDLDSCISGEYWASYCIICVLEKCLNMNEKGDMV
nr:hypothetical protein Iba_chr04dCG14090 [Ipomoea batatas]